MRYSSSAVSARPKSPLALRTWSQSWNKWPISATTGWEWISSLSLLTSAPLQVIKQKIRGWNQTHHLNPLKIQALFNCICEINGATLVKDVYHLATCETILFNWKFDFQQSYIYCKMLHFTCYITSLLSYLWEAAEIASN